MAVSSAAYTVTKDGLYTTYDWEWSSSASFVRSHMTTTAYQPSMKITANMFGVNKRQNGGVNTSGLSLYNTEDVSAEGEYKINFSVCGPLTLNSSGTEAVEWPCVWFVTATPRESFSTSSSFSFKVSLNTIDGFLSSDNTYLVNQSRVRLYNGTEQVYLLEPTVISSELIYSIDTNTASSKQLIHYDLLFSLDVESDELVEFDYISFDFPCVVSLYDPFNSNQTTYSRYSISCSNPQLVIAPSQTMIDDLLVVQNGNDDLITKLGTVNTVDQARINAQSSAYNEVAAVTGGLSDMTDFSESLSSQVDLSQDVDVLSDGALIDSVNNMWDLFPWESQFMTTAIGMVGSIALLSLVLHGGERALFSSKGNNRKSSKKGDDS